MKLARFCSFKSSGFVCSTMVMILSAGSMARADLRFVEPVADAGEVKTGISLKHRFDFVNQGKETVEITGVHASCGCLTPKLEQRRYRAGEKGTLVLEVNTLTQSAGFHNWRAQVAYRAGETVHEMPLELRARLITEIAVRPASLTLVVETGIHGEVTVTDLRSKPLTVTEARTSSPNLKPRLLPAIKDSEGRPVRTIGLDVAADYPEGRHNEILSILTDDPAYSEIKVPVSIVKRSAQSVTAAPKRVELSAHAGQPVPSRIVLIRAGEDSEVVVDRVVTDDPAVVCQWARGPGSMATVRVNVDRSRLKANQMKTQIHVSVSKPQTQVISIPVSCVVD